MNSKSLLLRTDSAGSISIHVPTVSSSPPRPSVSLSVSSRYNIRRSCSLKEIKKQLEPRLPEELELRGGGANKNGNSSGGGKGSDGAGNRNKMGAYYQEMIRSDSTNSLLLRNYAKYLHEVEGDAAKAEEYYGRAILASPGDGELLSLYGKLIWEVQRDESRAKSYFTHALHASPNDSMVLGCYAHFLWEVEEKQYGCEEEVDMKRESVKDEQAPIAAMVETF